MQIINTAIDRPVTTTMLSMALIVLGLFSYMGLGVDLFPNVELPIVTVQTSLKGASPEEIETSVTKPIEESVNTISGIDDLNSTSYEGLSVLVIKFVLEKSVDVAAQETRDKVNAVQRDLPQGTDPPVVSKLDFGAFPIMNITVSGNRDLVDLTHTVKKKLKEHLETINGVGAINIIGGREREIHIVINPLKLAALGFSIKQVRDAITQQNIEIPGGRVQQKEKEFVLRTLGRISNVADFDNIVIAKVNGTAIKIADIGRTEDTGAEARTMAFLDGKPTVALSVTKQSGSNTVAVARLVRERLKELKTILPPDFSIKIIGDQSTFIDESVATVKEHLILGALMAGLMVLLFMGDWRSTLISATAIPTSLIGTFIFMRAAGFTLDNMTLLGLTLSVGIVVDDGIIMLENIYRHMDELGKPAMQAAREGADEIGFAVIATSMSLLVIFLPLAYMGGIIGRFIKSYGLTIAFAIAISIFVALTLTPMLCSIFLKVKHGAKTRLEEITDAVNDYLNKRYLVLLDWAMSHRKTMAALSAALILSMLPMLKFIGKDFIPQDDTSQFEVVIKAPEGTTPDKMREIFSQITTELRRQPHIKSVLQTIGQSTSGTAAGNEGQIILELDDLKRRSIPMSKLMKSTRQIMSKYTALRVSIQPVGGFGGGDRDVQYIISGPELGRLQEYAGAIANELRKHNGLVDVDLSFSFAKPEYRVEIDRSRAHDMGVKVEDIATSLRTMVGGEEDITKYKDGDELYQVRLRAEENYRNRLEAIRALIVPTAKSGVLRLDSVATVAEGFGPTQIDRYARQRQISVLANLDGMALGDALKLCDAEFKKLHAPAEYRAVVTGRAREMGRMLTNFLMAFLLAFLFIYMILASQFESFVYPISIIIALPLTIPFALLTLFMTGQSLTLFSIMGLFMLVGIVKKNAILQVDYTNTLRARGLSRHDAIMEANKTRLRPILMTTLTLIASMLPTAFGTGAGSGTRRAMAWVIVGGQALSLLITLLMTPVTYSLLDDLSIWAKKRFGWETRPDAHS
ncbi:MAG: efflux RND transporter permease subunit [Elusimicrobiales bacterium]|nr:efflux RND transporter permease subunit [Elusimicrobiales bacterium]